VVCDFPRGRDRFIVAELDRAELLAMLAARDAVIAELQATIVELRAVNAVLVGRVAELEARLGKNSSTSSRPPSCDGPYVKPTRTSSRTRSGRRPGKQPGDPGTTRRQSADPDQVVVGEPERCSGCGCLLAGAELVAVARRQVVDVPPPPPPVVIEYQVVSRRCAHCQVVSVGQPPPGVLAPVSFGPEVSAQATNILCGHYVPVGRAAELVRATMGIEVSTGFLATLRAKAAARLETTFLPRVRDLLAHAEVLHVDETPARTGGAWTYVHVACTEHLTALHTGDRSAATIDAGGVLPGFAGVIVRDGYAGYTHLCDAHHAWCAAHYPDSRIIPTSDRSVLVSGGSRAVTVGIITALRGRRATRRAAGSGPAYWSAGWSGPAPALSG